MNTKFKTGHRVRMASMWKYDEAIGTIIKVTKEYVVVTWDNVNGHWHYTEEQAKKLSFAPNSISDEEAMWRTWGDQ